MSSPVPFWFVEVVGEAFYVYDLPYFFPNGASFVYKDDGRTWLKSVSFHLEMTAAQVHAEAERILDGMSAALCVSLGHFVRPKIGTVYLQHPEGHRTGHHVLRVDGMVSRSKLRGSLSTTNGQTLPQQFLEVASRCPHLQTASLIWSDQLRTWPRLYRIMEEVQQHLQTSPDKAGLCQKNEYKTFERTANSAEAAGIDARHASGKFEPPPFPMSLNEAEAFVGRVLEQAFRRALQLPQ